MNHFVDCMANALLESGRRSKRLSLQNTLMVATARRYRQDIEYMHNLCDEIVKERRKNPNDVNDLLNRMINGKDPETGYQLSDENIRYQMVTFLIAGHETTSGLLSFATYFLLKNPQAFQKAQAEVDQFDEITFETLGKLKYIDAILKETLRLQPTAPGFSLQCKQESIVLPGGYEANKNDSINVLIHELHRDPKVWDRPEEFLPERMLDGGFEKLPPNSWKPFGNGQRACIGRPFAWQESLLVLALILKHFNIELVDSSYDLRIKQTLTIKPNGLKMRVRPRQPIGVPLDTKAKGDKKPSEKPKENVPTADAEPLSILYGSNSGSCESFARNLASEATNYGYKPTVATLDSAVGSLPTDQPVIIVTASYEGQPCDNAKHFIAFLQSKPKLNDIQYAVFGAGHRDWAKTYQKIPTFVDQTIEQCGGKRILERGEGDAAGDFFGSFDSWKDKLFQVLRKDSSGQNAFTEDKLSIEIVQSTRSLGQVNEVGIVQRNEVLVEASDFGPEKRQLEIKLPEGQTYRTGDYLAVLPLNVREVVDRVLKHFNLSADAHIKIVSTTETFFPTNHPVSAFDILSGYVELNKPITKKQLETLAEACQDQNEQKKLHDLAGENYETEVLDKRISILDILELNPSCQVSFSQYLKMLPSLRVRQYSISSSHLWNDTVVTLTIDVLKGPAFSGHGQYYGVASSYLARRKKDDRLTCTVRPSNITFHPPDDTKIPMVMIAAGTGIAPFRGFIQERAALLACGRDVGPAILYFGCRSEQDYLYADELKKWSELGAVQIKMAFSRKENQEKQYVQDLLWQDRQDILDLYRNNARFYTCGSAKKLGASVKTCIIKIISDLKKCNEEEAEKTFEKVARNRYSVDVFL